jgi:VWFA-related protein
MTRVLTVLVAAVAALGLTTGVGARQTSQRTVYVTATTGKYVPVMDLAASDFVVKEDGKAREIVKAERATVPLHVALMLDNGGVAINAIRQGSAELVKALQGNATFTVVTIGGRALTLVEFTDSVPTVFVGLGNLLARNTTTTDLLDGMLELSAEFQRRKAERPVIIAIATEGEEVSNTRAPVVLEALQKSGTRLYYIGLGPPVTQGSRPSLAGNRPDSGTDAETANRNTVLGTGPKNSGGRSEQVLQDTGLVPLMKQFADELLNQYAVTYATDAPQAKLNVETKRKGVTLRAPARVGAR